MATVPLMEVAAAVELVELLVVEVLLLPPPPHAAKTAQKVVHRVSRAIPEVDLIVILIFLRD